MGLTGFNLARRQQEQGAAAQAAPLTPVVVEEPAAAKPKRSRKKVEAAPAVCETPAAVEITELDGES